MSTKNFTIPEVLAEIAKTVKTQIADYEATLTSLRKKELERSHGKLNKSELCLLCAGPEFNCSCTLQKSEGGMKKSAMASSSASALNPPKSRPPTPVAVANHEMGGFKSIASKPPISSMGRSKASASGSIMAKDEMGADSSMMMSEPCAKCGKSGEDCKCMGKAEINSGQNSKIAKVSGEIGNSTKVKPGGDIWASGPAKEVAHKFSAQPKPFMNKMELSTTPKKGGNETGSGGETKKMALKKSTIPTGNKAPEVQGVAGKQPMGQDGGGVNKISRGLADVTGGAGNVHPTAPVQTAQPGIKVRGGSAWLKTTNASAHRIHPGQAAVKSQRFHGALPLQRAEMELNKNSSVTGLGDDTADKEDQGIKVPRGVGTVGSGPIKVPETMKPKKPPLMTKMEDLGKCAMCKSEEHAGKCMKAQEA